MGAHAARTPSGSDDRARTRRSLPRSTSRASRECHPDRTARPRCGRGSWSRTRACHRGLSPPSAARRSVTCSDVPDAIAGERYRPGAPIPLSAGLNGSDTSNCFSSPVPQHETYRNRSSRERLMSVTSGGTAPNPLSRGGSCAGSAGSAGISMTFRIMPGSTVPIPGPDRGRQVLQARNGASEPVGLGWVVRRPQLEHHLIFRTELELLDVSPLMQIPHVQGIAVLARQQQLRVDAVLRPFAACPTRS